jgi:septal ring factor EnvC (AmiA/AmiB activator)
MSSKGRKQDQAKRRKLRRRLEQLGYRPAQIEKRVAELDAKRARMHEAREHAERHIEQQGTLDQAATRPKGTGWDPDDRGYKPPTPDSLKTGAARATGATAKVVGRRNTITKWQYDEMEGTG